MTQPTVHAGGPFFTSTGCHTNLLASIASGATYLVEPDFDVSKTLARMARHETTSVFLLASALALIFARLSPQELAALRFPALRRIIHGAQPAGRDHYERLWSLAGQLGVELTLVYGLTEGGTCGIMLTPSDHAAAMQRIGPHGLSIGRRSFHPWVEYRVAAEDDGDAPVGRTGELCLRAPSVMSRYVREPEATAQALRGGWLHTGDMVVVDEDDFVYFVDRAKQMIRRGGLNISSAEVEAVLAEHPGVLEAAAVPMPNPVLGEDVRAVVVRADRPDVTDVTAEELIAHCRELLSDYKVPSRVDFVAALPRNGMGRVIKRALDAPSPSG